MGRPGGWGIRETLVKTTIFVYRKSTEIKQRNHLNTSLWKTSNPNTFLVKGTVALAKLINLKLGQLASLGFVRNSLKPTRLTFIIHYEHDREEKTLSVLLFKVSHMERYLFKQRRKCGGAAMTSEWVSECVCITKFEAFSGLNKKRWLRVLWNQ